MPLTPDQTHVPNTQPAKKKPKKKSSKRVVHSGIAEILVNGKSITKAAEFTLETFEELHPDLLYVPTLREFNATIRFVFPDVSRN